MKYYSAPSSIAATPADDRMPFSIRTAKNVCFPGQYRRPSAQLGIVIGVAGCLLVIPVAAFQLFSVLFEKDRPEEINPALHPR